MKIIIYPALLVAFYACSSGNQSNYESKVSEPTGIYEWRGPDRSGIYEESGLLKEWPFGGPEEIWSVEGIGNGFGSPVTDGDHIFITGEIDSMAILHCFSMDGKKIWQSNLGKEWTESYPGSRSTPTLVDSFIYVGTGMGDLYCLGKSDGAVVWRKDFKADFEGIYPMFGHSEAPAVDGDKIFWTPGGKEHNVVALNRFNGDLVWSNHGFGERSGYNQPKVIRLSVRNIFVTFSAYHMMGFDTETGTMLWSDEQENIPVDEREPGKGDTHCNTVLYEPGYIYYAEGDGNCGIKFSLSSDGSELNEIWRNKDFDSFMGGIVKNKNYLYGSGTAEPGLYAINAITGEIRNSLRVGRGVIIAADGTLYYYNHQGKFKLIQFDDGNMKEISSFRIRKGTKEHFSHPIIHNGILYLRHGDVLMAFNIRSETMEKQSYDPVK